MLRLTQTNTEPGNCWQTAVACVLEVPLEDLPDQVGIEASGERYWNFLGAYLEAHHGMMYTEVPDYQHPALRPVGYHLMVGPTERTTPDHDVHHVVVGFQGEVRWDPHPSRAGLVRVEKWGVLTPQTEIVREQRNRMRTSGNLTSCVCPRCGGWAR